MEDGQECTPLPEATYDGANYLVYKLVSGNVQRMCVNLARGKSQSVLTAKRHGESAPRELS